MKIKHIVQPLLIAILFLCFNSASASSKPNDLTALFFFSSTCVHCKKVEPAVKAISKEFKVTGLLYGKGAPPPMPFEVRKGDKATAEKYGITGVPILVVLRNGAVKQIIRGEHDIEDALPILRAFRRGALSVSEAVEKGAGIDYTVAGWIVSRGSYFKDAHFFLTDRAQNVAVIPWLPLETVKSPFRKQRPRLMSDVVDRPAMLKGSLLKTESGLRFNVKEEVKIE